MKVVVDTNVIAYFLLDTEPLARDAKLFWHWVEQPLAPAVWEAELANVVWMAIRKGIVPRWLPTMPKCCRLFGALRKNPVLS